MPQHVTPTSGESDGLWLPLTEYAVRSGISLSTIRRKIKSNSIPYKLERGRYLILFREGKRSPLGNRLPPAQKSTAAQEEPMLPRARSRTDSYADRSPSDDWTEHSLEKSVQMVSEAFEYTLKERDARILQLERKNQALTQQCEELKLLVKVLEAKYRVRY